MKVRLVACVSFLYVSTLRTSDKKVRIHSKTIRNFLGKYSSSFLQFVCSFGVPQMFTFGQNYKNGERSREYCANREFKGSFKPCLEFQQNEVEKIFESFRQRRKTEESQSAFPVPELKKIAAQLTVDRSNIDDAIQAYKKRKSESNESFDLDKALNLLEIVECGPEHHGYFFFREDSRLYSSISILPREFRKLLRYQGLPFVELDQCASQPFLLLRLYRDLKTIEANQEAHRYADLWNISKNNGDFYTNLIPNLKPDERNAVKASFINDYLNRAEFMKINDPIRAQWRDRCENAIKTQFPILHDLINDLKTVRKREIEIEGNRIHSQFAIKMQQLESIVFIDRIAAECMENHLPIYTVHDCIACLEEHRQQVTEIAIRCLKEFCGFEPRFK